MATTSLMTLGTQAVFAAYAQLQTTGNNIANANTPGYSRQAVQLATAGSSGYTGAGYFGRGVTVSTVARAANMFLGSQAVAAGSTAAADGAQRDMLSQLEKLFVGGSAGLGAAATQIFNAFADVAAAPGDLSARQAVLGRLEDFASLARASSSQIEVLQAQVKADVAGGVAEVNALAASLGRLNLSIAAATRSGQSPNDLLDQRDQLVQRIGQQVQVHSYIGADETANVFVGSGQSLVLGGVSHALVAQADAADASHVSLGVAIAGQTTPLGSDTIGDGRLGGLMRFQDQDLADARGRLGQLVAGLAGAVNQQQGFGLDLQGSAGTPLFGLTGPRAQPAAGNARDASGAFVASVGLAIVDFSALKASDYQLVADPANAGQYSVTRLADGQLFQPVADGAVIDGFRVTVGANAPAPGESFLLKPVSGAAADLTVLLKNPRGLAAANPVTAVLGAANSGTASVMALTIVAAPAAPYAPFTVRFVDDNGGYEVLDAGNNPLATGSYSSGQPIQLDGISLALAGQAKTGDRISVAPTSHPAASNGNALRFDSLAASPLIDGQTAADAYANTLSAIGVRMQGAAAAADTSSTVAQQASAALGGAVGVNLDEEAARLLQFQQSYQAAAKMLQTAQTMFDAILGVVR